MKPIPKDVAAALRYYAEHGVFPPDTEPQVREMAEKLNTAARAMQDPFKEVT